MSTLAKLQELAAEHHEHAAWHHREAAKLFNEGDLMGGAHEALMAHGHLVHAIHHAREAAKENATAHGGEAQGGQ